MGIVEDIGVGPVCLDTCIFIYFVEEHKEFINIILPIFEAIDQGRLTAVTSGITLLETLVVPFRKGNADLAEQYERILTSSSKMLLFDLDKALLKEAASLRATYGIKTPDALQLAVSRKCKCSAFVTNDRDLPKVDNLRILQLSNYSLSFK